jgi:hypothetical protein
LASCSQDTTVLVWDVTGLATGRTAVGRHALAGLWEDLGSADPATAYAAICRGATARDAAVAALEAKLKPLARVDPAKVREWIRQLDSDKFADRERASRSLAELGPAAEELLGKAAAGSESVEVRARLKRILGRFAAQRRSWLRAVEMLQMIGTRQAKRALAGLAAGADAPLTREAAAAVKRLAGRK